MNDPGGVPPELSQMVSEPLARGLAGVDQPCHACGHNLRDLTVVVCPECGTVVAAPVAGVRAAAPAPGSARWLVWWRWATTTAAGVLLAVVVSSYGVSRVRDRALLSAGMLAVVAVMPHAVVGVRRLISGSRPTTGAEVGLAVLSTLALVAAAGVAV